MCCFDYDSDIYHKKRIIRREVLEKLMRFDGKEESQYIVNSLRRREDYMKATTILSFYPMRSEPDIKELFFDKRIAFPYIENDKMHFSTSLPLEKNKLGFMEPRHIPLDFEYAIMLVPLIAFDDENFRLGRGGGFYDRFIRENREKVHSIGIAYSISHIERVPRDSNDEKLDEILYLKQ